jgi:hypothetical protein
MERTRRGGLGHPTMPYAPRFKSIACTTACALFSFLLHFPEAWLHNRDTRNTTYVVLATKALTNTRTHLCPRTMPRAGVAAGDHYALWTLIEPYGAHRVR